MKVPQLSILNKNASFYKAQRSFLSPISHKPLKNISTSQRGELTLNPVEKVILEEGLKLPFEQLKLKLLRLNPKQNYLTLGNIPSDVAKNELELEKLIRGNLFLNKLKGLLTGKRVAMIHSGRSFKILKLTTRKDAYVIKLAGAPSLNGSVYKDTMSRTTAEFIDGIRNGLADDALLAYAVTRKNYPNISKFYYYNEKLGCSIKEFIHGKLVEDSVYRSKFNQDIMKDFGVCSFDDMPYQNIIEMVNGERKIVDFGFWKSLQTQKI